ncbi:hypothetical protein GJ700_02635 [Duganella sp. FT92W]|uniref:PNPLA domain-containing protein n=1 Tax=Pseudoduganella rivuli TaxID=2666085 RepID=A0A7X2IIU7_9BURK|nr:hypothetical protein [Pseudoduganella rivuli]MRV70616.1 hypothetical protein [Pseudoduganella rivuli]
MEHNHLPSIAIPDRPIALALSGGGKRAALFQCGGLMALAALERLRDVKLVSSISGGSLAALALKRVLALEAQRGQDKPGELHLGWGIYEFLAKKIASHDFRTEATFGLKHAAMSLAEGQLRITESIAQQIDQHLGQDNIDTGGPITLLGACKVDTKELEAIPLCTANASRAVAAAMALPGLVDAIAVADHGVLVDGGLADKTGLQLLQEYGWQDDVVLLDASTRLNTLTSTRLSALTSAVAIMEADSEAKRPQLLQVFGTRLSAISLRDANTPGVRAEFLGRLAAIRTDLDHFSPLETDSLVIAGFIATCVKFGDTPADAFSRLERYGTFSPCFKDNAETLGRAVRTDGQHKTKNAVWYRLDILLKKGKRSALRDLFSGHPYLRLTGTFSAIFAPAIVGTWSVAFLMGLLLLGAMVSDFWGVSLATGTIATALLTGLVATGWLKYIATHPLGIKYSLFLVCTAPLLLVVAQSWHFVLNLFRSSELVSTIAYPLGTLGRLGELIDPRQYRGPFSKKKAVQMVATLSLAGLLCLNPFALLPQLETLLPLNDAPGWLIPWISNRLSLFTLACILGAELGFIFLNGISQLFKYEPN